MTRGREGERLSLLNAVHIEVDAARGEEGTRLSLADVNRGILFGCNGLLNT